MPGKSVDENEVVEEVDNVVVVDGNGVVEVEYSDVSYGGSPCADSW